MKQNCILSIVNKGDSENQPKTDGNSKQHLEVEKHVEKKTKQISASTLDTQESGCRGAG